MESVPGPPRRRFGQHFLVDRSAIGRIVDALELADGEPVLEIGPGRGALTETLLDRGAQVVAVEVDRDLAASLRRRFAERPLRVLEGDVLGVDLAALREPAVERWRIVGNLPYNISKPIAMRLVDLAEHVDRAVLMFQREVAERLVAAPGEAAYGPLSILPAERYAIERLFDLPPGCFRPPPAVHSTVTRWRALPGGDVPLAPLRAVVRAAFASRRKTLRNNLRAALGSDEAARALLARCGIDPDERAERLDRARLRRLAAHWPGDA